VNTHLIPPDLSPSTTWTQPNNRKQTSWDVEQKRSCH